MKILRAAHDEKLVEIFVASRQCVWFVGFLLQISSWTPSPFPTRQQPFSFIFDTVMSYGRGSILIPCFPKALPVRFIALSTLSCTSSASSNYNLHNFNTYFVSNHPEIYQVSHLSWHIVVIIVIVLRFLTWSLESLTSPKTVLTWLFSTHNWIIGGTVRRFIYTCQSVRFWVCDHCHRSIHFQHLRNLTMVRIKTTPEMLFLIIQRVQTLTSSLYLERVLYHYMLYAFLAS